MAQLELQGLRRTYAGINAVDGVSLHLAAGSLVALLGPSGCGKSTTLRMIAGLEQPDAGRILVAGQDVTHLPPWSRRMGVVFQSYALFPHMTVEANVGFGLRMQGVGTSERLRRSRAALDLVGLSDHAGKKPRQLSGGQQQRVALARALAIEPTLLLLDEPLSALDAKLRDELRVEMRILQRRLGATAVFVTHDQAEALAMADQVAVMERGRIAQLGTPEDVFERPATAFVATFVGRSARLPGTAHGTTTRCGPGSHGSTLHTATPHHGPVTLFIRPHRIRLLAPGAPALDGFPNVLDGTIASIDYTGATVELVLDTPAGRVPIDLPADDPAWRTLTPGAPARAGWEPSHTMAFPA